MTNPTPSMKDRLSNVVVSARDDLDITRHQFRDGPGYVLRDPVSFRTIRLDPVDYRVFGAISTDKTLSETFSQLVAQGVLSANDEDRFYDYVVSMHRAGVLSLPVNDGAALYRRFDRKQRMMRRSMVMGFLFMRVPLISPDAFLDRTICFFRPLFTRTAFALWCLLMMAGIALAAGRWSDLTAPLMSMLQAQNLLTMWFVLIGLKIVHEFGHAYACKRFGAGVPEMGAFFIVFTPCAYMDATASWGLPSRIHRAVISLGGMYFESIVGVVALFVWASTDPSMLNTIAYQTVLLSTVVTVTFNLNPLMRYDGYYLLSDMLAIPNLRTRSYSVLQGWFNRIALGLRTGLPAGDRSTQLLLASYGVSSMIYRVVLVISICALIATKLYLIGLALGVFFLATTVGGSMLKTLRYLWASPTTAPVRTRSVLVGACLAALLPLAMTLIPVRLPVAFSGTLDREVRTTLRARVGGELNHVRVRDGEHVIEGQTLATLRNDDVLLERQLASDELRVLDVRFMNASHGDAREARQVELQRRHQQERIDHAETMAGSLDIRAGATGVLLAGSVPEAGTFLPAGSVLGEIVNGPRIAVFLVPESDLINNDLAEGSPVICRALTDPLDALTGEIRRISPAGSRWVDHPSLTVQAGGTIAVDPISGKATVPYFEVTIALDEAGADSIVHGTTLRMQLLGPRRSVAAHAADRISRFINELKTN